MVMIKYVTEDVQFSAALNSYKELMDNLDLLKVGNGFVLHKDRFFTFNKFNESDFEI